jgi:hypothetical protein
MGGNTVKKRCLLIMGILLVMFGTKVFAWDNVFTHPKLTEKAIGASKLDDYLKRVLDIPTKKETVLQQNQVSKTILDWLRYSSNQEDDPACRAMNHFHNPLKKWYESALTDLDTITQKRFCPATSPYSPANIISDISWATGFKSPDEPHGYIRDNPRNWYYTRAYYYMFLTGKSYEDSFSDNPFGDSFVGYGFPSPDRQIRESNLAICFESLGYVLHLLQDMAVPAQNLIQSDVS